jgi:uncharacterized membrane protein
MNTRHLILLLLWGAIAVQCLHYFPQLPAGLASHFDGAGRANGWSSKEGFFVFYLVMTGLMTLVFFLLPVLLRGVPPSLINIPNREYWLVPERKDLALTMLEEEMGWFGNGVLVMMIATIQLAINANLPGGPGFRSDLMWILLAGFFLFLVFWLVRLYRRFAVHSA